jgi:hypothetical protein
MSSWFNELKSLQNNVIGPAFSDFMRSIPDSMFIGSSVFALMTQNFPLGIFVLAMMEFSLVHRVIGGIVSSVESSSSSQTVKPTDICTSGIPSPYQITIVGKLLSQTPFPSGPIFFMSAVILYTVSAILNFSQELEELSKKESEWALRLPLSCAFGLLFFIGFAIWRYMNSCDGFLVILGSALLGLTIGGLVHLLHVYLFGRDSINFLGVPLLADRAANGKPLYVCAKTS